MAMPMAPSTRAPPMPMYQMSSQSSLTRPLSSPNSRPAGNDGFSAGPCPPPPILRTTTRPTARPARMQPLTRQISSHRLMDCGFFAMDLEGAVGGASASSAVPVQGSLGHLKRKYGDHAFERDEGGSYTCFFVGCRRTMKANFQRHVSAHEEAGDVVDKQWLNELLDRWTEQQERAEERGHTIGYAGGVAGGKMCVYEDHDRLWPTLPRVQPEENFYTNSQKCKKCYIYLQSNRIRRARLGLPTSSSGSSSSSSFSMPLAPRRASRFRDPEAPPTPFRAGAAAAVSGGGGGGAGGPRKRRREVGPEQADVLAPRAGRALREAAVGAAWSAAILAEARAGLIPQEQGGQEVPDHPLSSLSPEVSLARTGQRLRALLVTLAHDAGRPEVFRARAAAVWRRAELRLQEGRAAVREAGLEEGGGCTCGQTDAGKGMPWLCLGCGRAMHGTCGNVEAKRCGECDDGRVVAHRVRGGYGMWEMDPPGGAGAAVTLGQVMDLARRRNALLTRESRELDVFDSDD